VVLVAGAYIPVQPEFGVDDIELLLRCCPAVFFFRLFLLDRRWITIDGFNYPRPLCRLLPTGWDDSVVFCVQNCVLEGTVVTCSRAAADETMSNTINYREPAAADVGTCTLGSRLLSPIDLVRLELAVAGRTRKTSSKLTSCDRPLFYPIA